MGALDGDKVGAGSAKGVRLLGGRGGPDHEAGGTLWRGTVVLTTMPGY